MLKYVFTKDHLGPIQFINFELYSITSGRKLFCILFERITLKAEHRAYYRYSSKKGNGKSYIMNVIIMTSTETTDDVISSRID